MAKRRLKFTRQGWFAHWFTMASGWRDYHTGTLIPDEYGCTTRELWVGPFDSAKIAFERVRD